jgi:hypothetical protein
MHRLLKVSNPDRVQANLDKYFDKPTNLYLSTKSTKKYMIQKPNGSFVHFGDINFQDYTKHLDEDRRARYLQRASNIPGDWYDDAYSSNNLAIFGLWQ